MLKRKSKRGASRTANKKTKSSTGKTKTARPSRRFSWGWQWLWPTVWLTLLVGLTMVSVKLVTAVKSQPIERVAITGDMQHIARDNVIDILQPYLADGFVMLNMRSIREDLRAHPWVDDVRIQRVAAGELSVEIIEQQAIARWGNRQLLNRRGEIFTPGKIPQAMQSLPLLKGEASQVVAVMNQFNALNEQFQRYDMHFISLTQDQRGLWQGVLSNGVEIVLGDTPLQENLKRFDKVLQQALLQKIDQVDSVDLRYSNGLAVAWR